MDCKYIVLTCRKTGWIAMFQCITNAGKMKIPPPLRDPGHEVNNWQRWCYSLVWCKQRLLVTCNHTYDPDILLSGKRLDFVSKKVSQYAPPSKTTLVTPMESEQKLRLKFTYGKLDQNFKFRQKLNPLENIDPGPCVQNWRSFFSSSLSPIHITYFFISYCL